jgi:thioesterase domain-containing protein
MDCATAELSEHASTRGNWLERHLHESIPLVRAMAIKVQHAELDRVVLGMPLAPNSNDKGCGFGGSMASLLTLSGWSLLRINLPAGPEKVEIYIQDSEISYLKPAWGDCQATVSWSDAERNDWLSMLSSRGKARARLQMRLESEAIDCATMSARFVALAVKS